MTKPAPFKVCLLKAFGDVKLLMNSLVCQRLGYLEAKEVASLSPNAYPLFCFHIERAEPLSFGRPEQALIGGHKCNLFTQRFLEAEG